MQGMHCNCTSLQQLPAAAVSQRGLGCSTGGTCSAGRHPSECWWAALQVVHQALFSLRWDVLQVDIHKVVAQVFSTLSTLKKGDVQMWNDIDDSTPNIMADSGRVVQVCCIGYRRAVLCHLAGCRGAVLRLLCGKQQTFRVLYHTLEDLCACQSERLQSSSCGVCQILLAVWQVSLAQVLTNMLHALVRLATLLRDSRQREPARCPPALHAAIYILADNRLPAASKCLHAASSSSSYQPSCSHQASPAQLKQASHTHSQHGGTQLAYCHTRCQNC